METWQLILPQPTSRNAFEQQWWQGDFSSPKYHLLDRFVCPTLPISDRLRSWPRWSSIFHSKNRSDIVFCWDRKIIFWLTCSCRFLHPNNFSNFNSNCSDLLDMRNLQEQVKNTFCHQKLIWPFTVPTNCSVISKFLQILGLQIRISWITRTIFFSQ